MTSSEIRYLNELYEIVLDKFFVSFEDADLSDSQNLISQIKLSPHPLVLLAFLEASTFDSDENCNPFCWINLPKRSEVFRVFNTYNGILPKNIYLKSNNGFCDVDSKDNVYLWEGTQKAIFNPATCKLTYTRYIVKVSYLHTALHGYGKIPVDPDLHFC